MLADMPPRGLRALSFVLSSASLLATAGCSQLQLASAGPTACAPKEIEVRNVERSWKEESWEAVCKGVTYRCSQVATAWAVDVTCTEVEGQGPVPDAAEPGASAGTEPSEDDAPETSEAKDASDDGSPDTSPADGTEPPESADEDDGDAPADDADASPAGEDDADAEGAEEDTPEERV
ncbi:MAG: hypothetical protein D6705_11560 [Deltaproteobacteria bacterium]|nr:MAG: hypothetical protein D6705_11560 [Deltaproteobacteria bacterium]